MVSGPWSLVFGSLISVSVLPLAYDHKNHLIYPWKSCGSTKKEPTPYPFHFQPNHKTHFAFISFRKFVRYEKERERERAEKRKKGRMKMKMMKMQLIPDGLCLLCQVEAIGERRGDTPFLACLSLCFCYNFYFILNRHLMQASDLQPQPEPEHKPNLKPRATAQSQRLTFHVAQLYFI